MGKISKDQYEYALERIEELLPVVDGYDPKQKELAEALGIQPSAMLGI